MIHISSRHIALSILLLRAMGAFAAPIPGDDTSTSSIASSTDSGSSESTNTALVDYSQATGSVGSMSMDMSMSSSSSSNTDSTDVVVSTSVASSGYGGASYTTSDVFSTSVSQGGYGGYGSAAESNTMSASTSIETSMSESMTMSMGMGESGCSGESCMATGSTTSEIITSSSSMIAGTAATATPTIDGMLTITGSGIPSTIMTPAFYLPTGTPSSGSGSYGGGWAHMGSSSGSCDCSSISSGNPIDILGGGKFDVSEIIEIIKTMFSGDDITSLIDGLTGGSVHGGSGYGSSSGSAGSWGSGHESGSSSESSWSWSGSGVSIEVGHGSSDHSGMGSEHGMPWMPPMPPSPTTECTDDISFSTSSADTVINTAMTVNTMMSEVLGSPVIVTGSSDAGSYGSATATWATSVPLVTGSSESMVETSTSAIGEGVLASTADSTSVAETTSTSAVDSSIAVQTSSLISSAEPTDTAVAGTSSAADS